MCSSRKNPYQPYRRSLEIPRGSGVLKANFLEAMYDNKPEFPEGSGMQNSKTFLGGGGRWWGGGGAKQKSFCGGEYGYFLKLHNIIVQGMLP